MNSKWKWTKERTSLLELHEKLQDFSLTFYFSFLSSSFTQVRLGEPFSSRASRTSDVTINYLPSALFAEFLSSSRRADSLEHADRGSRGSENAPPGQWGVRVGI